MRGHVVFEFALARNCRLTAANAYAKQATHNKRPTKTTNPHTCKQTQPRNLQTTLQNIEEGALREQQNRCQATLHCLKQELNRRWLCLYITHYWMHLACEFYSLPNMHLQPHPTNNNILVEKENDYSPQPNRSKKTS